MGEPGALAKSDKRTFVTDSKNSCFSNCVRVFQVWKGWSASVVPGRRGSCSRVRLECLTQAVPWAAYCKAADGEEPATGGQGPLAAIRSASLASFCRPLPLTTMPSLRRYPCSKRGLQTQPKCLQKGRMFVSHLAAHQGQSQSHV